MENPTMDELANLLTSQFVIIVALVAGYQSAFGPRQTEITEAVIQAFSVPKRYKPLVNIVASVVVATLIGLVLAVYTNWQVIPIAAIAGLLASTKAAEVHDAQKAEI